AHPPPALDSYSDVPPPDAGPQIDSHAFNAPNRALDRKGERMALERRVRRPADGRDRTHRADEHSVDLKVVLARRAAPQALARGRRARRQHENRHKCGRTRHAHHIVRPRHAPFGLFADQNPEHSTKSAPRIRNDASASVGSCAVADQGVVLYWPTFTLIVRLSPQTLIVSVCCSSAGDSSFRISAGSPKIGTPPMTTSSRSAGVCSSSA